MNTAGARELIVLGCRQGTYLRVIANKANVVPPQEAQVKQAEASYKLAADQCIMQAPRRS